MPLDIDMVAMSGSSSNLRDLAEDAQDTVARLYIAEGVTEMKDKDGLGPIRTNCCKMNMR